ncbi:MAG TPA: MFS transporter [Mycobacteriales bacterium]|nr:MFS transporter [Mycobacteriales bacterium]
MSRATEIRELFAEPGFRTLLATRLTSQTADGLFQTSLAGAVLFNPEHHTGPTTVAAGFVVLLLPYSLVGPFAGVFLDRWHRQRVLMYGATVKSVLVLATAAIVARHGPGGAAALTALAALAINRFYLAALSAALPSVVRTERLVLANAICPTAGTAVTIAGAGIGLILRSAGGGADHGDALAALGAAIGYVAAALVSARMSTGMLGPHPPSISPLREQLTGIVRGLVAGARHLRQRPAAAHALGVIFAQRFLFGIWSIMTLLLYRNAFHSHGVLRAGLVGVGQAVSAAGVGLVLAAAVTPWVTARIGKQRWIVTVTLGVAATELALGAPFSMSLLIVSSFALGFSVQATKVCVDTLVQTSVLDEFRGRVFSLYDTIYNLSFVGAAILAAFVLPTNGRSLGALIAMSVGYVAIAAIYPRSEHATISALAEQTTE